MELKDNKLTIYSVEIYIKRFIVNGGYAGVDQDTFVYSFMNKNKALQFAHEKWLEKCEYYECYQNFIDKEDVEDEESMKIWKKNEEKLKFNPDGYYENDGNGEEEGDIYLQIELVEQVLDFTKDIIHSSRY